MENFYNKRGQMIGSLNENIFRKRVKKSRHLFKMLNAWGLDLDTLNQLKESGCTEVRIWETEEDKIYSTPLEKLWKEAEVMSFDGQQAFLPRSQWTITDK